MTTPLFDGIEAEMDEEEIALSRSTPGFQFAAERLAVMEWMHAIDIRCRVKSLPRKRSIPPTGPMCRRCRIGSSMMPSAYLRDVRERPVWQEMPADVRAFFNASLPHSPAPLGDVYRDVVGQGDALSDGQHPSALLVLVYGIEQFHRRARRFSGGDPGVQSRRRQPCRRPAWIGRWSTGASR